MLTKLIGSPNFDLNTKLLYILGKFTPFYRVMNKVVFVNLSPYKHSFKIDFLHAKFLTSLEKGISFNVGIIIQDEIFNQPHVIKPIIRLPYGYFYPIDSWCGVPPIKDIETTHYMVDIGK